MKNKGTRGRCVALDTLRVTIPASGTPLFGMHVVEFGNGFLPLAATDGSSRQ